MDQRWLDLLRQQHASGFADVAGARAQVAIPISDRLLTRLVAEAIPPSAPVRDLELRARSDNRFYIRARLTRPGFLPPISIGLIIDSQPQLPSTPVIALRLESAGLSSLAGVASRALAVLPPGIEFRDDKIVVDLRTLLDRRGVADALDYLEYLEITTVEGAFVVAFRAAVPAPRA